MSDLQSQAIQASLQGDWEIAIELNNSILEEIPNDIATLNRLARAYTELGQKDSAKSVYEKVLTIDKYNPIATKSLRILPSKKSSSDSKLADEDFVEQAGLTKTIQLVKIGGKDTLLSLTCKQALFLSPKSKLIAVRNEEGSYLGCLPDDISLLLKKNMKSGYKYSVCCKSTSENTITVFIRETHRPNRTSALPSFSKNGLKLIK